MRKRKSPTLAGMGRQKKVINVQGEGIPTVPVRQEICWGCGYFRAMRDAQKLRTFCLFTGELARPGTPACKFWPGVAFAAAVLDDVEPVAGVFRLTAGRACGKLAFPNHSRRGNRLFALPKGKRSVAAILLPLKRSIVSDGPLRILAGCNVREFVRPRRP